jgi:hypothetical protein
VSRRLEREGAVSGIRERRGAGEEAERWAKKQINFFTQLGRPVVSSQALGERRGCGQDAGLRSHGAGTILWLVDIWTARGSL